MSCCNAECEVHYWCRHSGFTVVNGTGEQHIVSSDTHCLSSSCTEQVREELIKEKTYLLFLRHHTLEGKK